MNNQQERALDHLLTTLDVAESDGQLAHALCHRAFAADLHHGWGSPAVGASAVYAALRQAGEPHSLDEIAEVADVDRSALGRAYKDLVHEFDLDIEPADPHEFVDRFADRLGAKAATESTAHQFVDGATEAGIRSGHSPTGTAAGALYLAGLLTGDPYRQDDVADAADVALVTLRNRYQDQAQLLGIEQGRGPWSSTPLVSSFDASGLSTEAVNEQLDDYQILESLLPSLVKQSRRNYSIPPYASGCVPADSFRWDASGGCRAAGNSVPPRAARRHRRAAL